MKIAAERVAHVNARRHHGGGVDQSGHRRGAFHGVRQPDIQRNLRRFSGSAQQHQQRDGSQHFHRLARRGLENLREIQRAEGNHDQEHRERKTEVADAVDDESLVARVGRALLHEVEADQQITAKTHAFPADEQQQIIRRQHQVQHEEHEQVQVGEEAVIAFLMRHVTGGVDMNQRADAGDDHQHDHGQLVDREIPADVESAALDPGEVMLVHGLRAPVAAEANASAPRANDRTTLSTAMALIDHLRQLASENAVDQKADERERGNEPEFLHQFFSGVDFVDVQSRAILEHRQDDRQPHGGFGSRDHHHEEREEVAADLLMLVGESDESSD